MLKARRLGRRAPARFGQVRVIRGWEFGPSAGRTGETEARHIVLLDWTAACGPLAEGEDPAYHGIYRGLVERPGTRLALLPDRPARTIVLLVRLTASRST